MLDFSALEHSHDDVIEARIRAHHKSCEPHHNDKAVTNDQPHFLLALVLVIVDTELDPRWEGQTQGGQAQCTE